MLQADNAVATARMRLLQQLGSPVDRDVTLTTTFELTEPTWTEEDLLQRALDSNPGLEASRIPVLYLVFTAVASLTSMPFGRWRPNGQSRVGTTKFNSFPWRPEATAKHA